MVNIDPRSGFCKEISTFHSKRNPTALPQNPLIDITTFISSQCHHGNTAFIDAKTGCHLTYLKVWHAVEAVASALSEMGICKGHVVLILSPNSIFFPILCMSVMSVGAIITTTNPLNTTQEIANQIKDSKPVLAFTIYQLVHKLDGTNVPIVLMDEGKKSACEARIVGMLKKMMMRKPRERRVNESVSMDDTATLLYSSGTTGVSKGVVLSHRNLIAMVQTIQRNYNPDHEDVFMCTIPMFHVYGLGMFALGLLASGSTIVILSKFDMDEMLSAIERYKVKYLPLVPPILVAMSNFSDKIKGNYDLSSLHVVISGGAHLSKEVAERFVKNYPNVAILRGYGLTESSSIGTATVSSEESRRHGTAGLLSPSMEAKIVDVESGEALGVNQRGELWLRGPTVMKGYLSNPEATASTLVSEGWLRTGDICYIDEDGFLFIVDRLKEMIKYKGYQIAPAELEALLLMHPEICDAAVIPFPDEEVGQFPMAYVVRKAGSNVSENAIIEFVAEQIAPYKRIRRVAFLSSIPKNPSGKILRKDLVKLATSKL